MQCRAPPTTWRPPEAHLKHGGSCRICLASAGPGGGLESSCLPHSRCALPGPARVPPGRAREGKHLPSAFGSEDRGGTPVLAASSLLCASVYPLVKQTLQSVGSSVGVRVPLCTGYSLPREPVGFLVPIQSNWGSHGSCTGRRGATGCSWVPLGPCAAPQPVSSPTVPKGYGLPEEGHAQTVILRSSNAEPRQAVQSLCPPRPGTPTSFQFRRVPGCPSHSGQSVSGEV